MVNVFGKIREAKQRVKQHMDDREDKRMIRTAKDLQELKKKRIRAETHAKVYAEKDMERSKLSDAKMQMRRRTPAYRVAHALKEEYKGYRKGAEKRKSGKFYGFN